MLWMLWWLFVEEEEDFEEGERDRERERYEEEVRSVAGIVVFLLLFFLVGTGFGVWGFMVMG